MKLTELSKPLTQVDKHIIPSLARGEDRRELSRPGYKDWRVNPRSYEFIGATFDPLTPVQTLARAKWMTVDHGFRFIVTPNVDHLVRVAKEPHIFNPLYEASWLSVCDSRILEMLANFSGIPLKAVPGSDLTQQLFDNVITADDTITVIYVFICVGSPQQEMIAKACLDRGDCVGLGLCVGASLDFLSGRTKRAPKWMQKIRMEWLFRLASEPKRLWKRYLIEGPKIFWLWTKWSMRKGRAKKQK